ncbi:unnamed protein product [Closterium sp. Naga37s-1]|nr:unnamed protein product [Closterium sp. Naga37s-1]
MWFHEHQPSTSIATVSTLKLPKLTRTAAVPQPVSITPCFTSPVPPLPFSLAPLHPSLTSHHITCVLPSARRSREFSTLLGSVAPAAPFYAVTIFRFPIYEFPPCTNVYTVYPPVVDQFLRTGERSAMPPVLFPTQHIGLVYGIPIVRSPFTTHVTVEQGKAKLAGFIAGAIDTETLISYALMDVLNQTTNKYSFHLYDVTDGSAPVLMFGANLIRKGSGILSAFLDPATIPPGDKEVQPFPEPFCSRTFEVHCRFLDSGSAWRLVWAPVLVAVLVAVVAVLLTLIVVFLARKQAAISRAVREVELCTAVLKRAKRSKSETVANLSHELRTPIVGMLGWCQQVTRPVFMFDLLLLPFLAMTLPTTRPCFPPPARDEDDGRPTGGERAAIACLIPTSSAPSFCLSPGMMEALLESELEGGQHRDLTTAKECAAAIVGQLNSVLDLAKLHAGRLSLETLPLSLRHCVDMVARDLLPEACKRGLHLVCQLDCSVPEVLLGDPLRLAQVVRELMRFGAAAVATVSVTVSAVSVILAVGGAAVVVAVLVSQFSPLLSHPSRPCPPLCVFIRLPCGPSPISLPALWSVSHLSACPVVRLPSLCLPCVVLTRPSLPSGHAIRTTVSGHMAFRVCCVPMPPPTTTTTTNAQGASPLTTPTTGNAVTSSDAAAVAAATAARLDFRAASHAAAAAAVASGSAGGEGGVQCREWLASWLVEACRPCSGSSGGSATIPPAAAAAAAAGSEGIRDGEGGREEAERGVGQVQALLRELEGCVSRFNDGAVVCASVDTAAAAADDDDCGDGDDEKGRVNEWKGGVEPGEREEESAVPSVWWVWRQSEFCGRVKNRLLGSRGAESGSQDTGGDGGVAVPSSPAAPSAASSPSAPASGHPVSQVAAVAGSREGHQGEACGEEGDSNEEEEGGEGGAGRGGVVVVMVCEDTGGGIPPEELHWVLDPDGQAAVQGRGNVLLQRGDSNRGGMHPPLASPLSPLHGSLDFWPDSAAPPSQSSSAPAWEPYPVRFLLSTGLEWVDHRKAICSLVAGKTALLLDAMPLRAQATEACLRYLGMDVTLAASPAQAMNLMHHPPTTTTSSRGGGGGGGGGSVDAGGGGGGWDAVFVDMDVSGPLSGLHVGAQILHHTARAAACSQGAGKERGTEGQEAGRAVVVLTGARADSVESEQAERMGFAAVLPHPWLVTHTAHCLQHLFFRAAERPPASPRASAAASLPQSNSTNTPAAAVPSPLLLPSVAPEEALRGLVGQQAVVVVDDNTVNRAVARRTLLALGALVHVAAGGSQALDWLRQQMAAATSGQGGPGHQQQQQQQAEGQEAESAVPLVLLDLQMPDMDGYETARRIRAMEAEAAASNAPAGEAHAGGSRGERRRWCVVALTADVDGDVRRACGQAGMDGVVAKPIVPRDLLAALKNAGYRS